MRLLRIYCRDSENIRGLGKKKLIGSKMRYVYSRLRCDNCFAFCKNAKRDRPIYYGSFLFRCARIMRIRIRTLDAVIGLCSVTTASALNNLLGGSLSPFKSKNAQEKCHRGVLTRKSVFPHNIQ